MLTVLMSMLLLVDQPVTPDAAPKARKPHMICKDEDSIGSIIPTRTCHTADDWKAIARDSESGAARDDVHRAQLEATMHGPTGH